MKVFFLRSAEPSVKWFVRYYASVFPAGALRASDRMEQALERLGANPMIGSALSNRGLREYSITKTPFSLIYRVTDERIEILQLRDQRAQPDDPSTLADQETR